MCYRVCTHSLRCDVRPVLSDGENYLVDPYAPPNRCSCRGERLARHPCRDHGCCSLSVRIYECPARCRTAIIYHIYTQRQPHKSVHFHHPEDADRWRDLPIFDGSIFPISYRPSSSSGSNRNSNRHTCALESVEFRLARDQILEIGRILDHTLLEIDKARFEARRLRQRHDRDHGSRCRREGCPALERAYNAQEHRENLELVADRYRSLWRRWKIYIRGLERQGDRRLGGLEEWRRRRGGASEREEHERLSGFYKREMRADEADARRREREREREREQHRAERKRDGPRRRDSGYESRDDYSGDEGGSRRGRRASLRDDRTFADDLRHWFR